MCGGEEQFFVDLKQLQISLSHPCLYCRTPLQAVTQLFLQTFTPPLSSSPYIPSFPFSQALHHCPFRNKTNSSHCLIQGILLSSTFVVLIPVSFDPVELTKNLDETKIVPSLRRILMSAISNHHE